MVCAASRQRLQPQGRLRAPGQLDTPSLGAQALHAHNALLLLRILVVLLVLLHMGLQRDRQRVSA